MHSDVFQRAQSGDLLAHSKLHDICDDSSTRRWFQADVSTLKIEQKGESDIKERFDEFGISAFKMPEFLAKNGYKNPNSLTINPYCHAHNTKGLDMWEFVALDPVRQKNLSKAMEAKSAQNNSPYDLFPFKEEFSKFNTTDETVLLVDIGGGNGQAVTAIRELCTDIKGKMILQDLENVIHTNTTSISGVDKMDYNFFTPQPVKGNLFHTLFTPQLIFQAP